MDDRVKVSMKKPQLIDALWGVWIPDGGDYEEGCWFYAKTDGPFCPVVAYADPKHAEAHADFFRGIFPRCYAAPLTRGAMPEMPD